MSTNTLSKETEKNLIDFFNKSVDPKVMEGNKTAKLYRCFRCDARTRNPSKQYNPSGKWFLLVE